MQYQYKFHKILSIKEREKDEAISLYQEATKKFEIVAEKLYELLKKKEEMESFQLTKLSSGLSVQEIRHHQQFIANIEKTIKHYQQLVIQARSRMNYMQEKLLEKNIEVKKYEKIKVRDLERYTQELKLDEGKLMDEISIQQYVGRGN